MSHALGPYTGSDIFRFAVFLFMCFKHYLILSIVIQIFYRQCIASIFDSVCPGADHNNKTFYGKEFLIVPASMVLYSYILFIISGVPLYPLVFL